MKLTASFAGKSLNKTRAVEKRSSAIEIMNECLITIRVKKMMNKKSSNILPVIGLIFVLLAGFGWCANIYKIITTGFELASWGGMEIMRVIGVFVAPLGALLGFF